MKKLESRQGQSMIKGLKNAVGTKKSQDLGMFILENKTLRGENTTCLLSMWKRANKRQEEKYLSSITSLGKTRNLRVKLQPQKFSVSQNRQNHSDGQRREA